MCKFRQFCAFLIGIGAAFTSSNIQIMGFTISIGALSVVLYFLSIFGLLSSYKLIRPTYGKFCYYPIYFFAILTFSNLLFYNGFQSIIPKSYILNYLVLVLTLIHSMYDTKATYYSLLGVGTGGVLLSIFFLMGIGMDTSIDSSGMRVSIFGANENEMGIIGCYAVVSIICILIYNDFFNLKKRRFFFLPLLALPISLIIASGSRTAFLSMFIIGLFAIFSLPSKYTFLKVFLVAAGVVGLIYAFSNVMAGDSVIAARMSLTLEEGADGHRTEFWTGYLSYFMESPIIGFGETGLLDLARRAGLPIVYADGVPFGASPHNVLVEVLMKTGILGFIPMLIFFIKAYKRAFYCAKYGKNAVPLLFGIPVLALILLGQIFMSKYVWIVFACMICSVNSNQSNSKI